ncbi:MAG: sugar isomerase domain-containing protein [Candidatus Nanopelagicales bacterium]
MESTSYISALTKLIDGVQATQNETLNTVAQQCATALESGGLIHLYGSGHSVIPTMDAYPRYGSFVGLHPIFDPRLMWHNVLGPGGVRELLWLERREDYAFQMLQNEPINAGDVFIAFSHGGTNIAAIEGVEYAASKGCRTVGITSLKNAGATARHSRGLKLSTVVDTVIDTGVPVEDALVNVGWTRPVGGSSTIVATIIMQELICRIAAILATKGIQLPTFVSPTVPGASVSSNDEVFAEHAVALHHAVGKSLEGRAN